MLRMGEVGLRGIGCGDGGGDQRLERSLEIQVLTSCCVIG